MNSVNSKALNESIHIERIIGHVKGKHPGPTLVFFGGVHGNESSGVFALHRVMQEFHENKFHIRGNVIAISGNLDALSRGVRYLDFDLNRIWTKAHVTSYLMPHPTMKQSSVEHTALRDILSLLRTIIVENNGPFYFFDLHTTSSDTIPFITINDTLLNRKFALHYPVPIILGIEEYLDGPILSYINQLGHIAIGFESGQHDKMSAIDNHIAFIYHSLVITGVLNSEAVKGFCRFTPSKIREKGNVFEILHRHEVVNGDKFVMGKGFVNFQTVQKGQQLASSNNELLHANLRGKIFMPLYQEQGDDGYFIIRRIPYLFLKASSLFRKIRFDTMLTWLPGIRWEDEEKKILRVNQHIAKFFAKDFLHLMGYRLKQRNEFHLSATKREDAKSNRRYKGEGWTKRKCIENPV